MNNLYKELATVYEAMYQTFINYEEEYFFYSKILNRYQKTFLLEIGSGTGNLAQRFLNSGFNYIGLDLSTDMIAIAKAKNPNGLFLEGDMRNFELEKQVSAVLLAGRTISYLLSNKDVNSMFSSIHQNLAPNGILCFDFIDANQFIPTITKGKTITHEANFQGINYLRKSYWTLNLEYGMDFKWHSTYFKKVDNRLLEIGQDNSVIRTFSIHELEIFLTINGFKIKAILPKSSYAFPTYVMVAERK